jgi:hypothetical protein
MAGSVAVVLPDDEQRRFHDEPEVAVLERASVALAHQEANQPFVALAHLVRGLVERDPRAVDDGQVRSERAVECEEPVIQNRNDIFS